MASVSVSFQEIHQVTENDYGITLTEIQKLMDSSVDLNFHLIPPIILKKSCKWSEIWRYGYVLKIINSEDSTNESFIEEYVNVLLHLKNENIPCPCPVKNKFGKYRSDWISQKQNISDDTNAKQKERHEECGTCYNVHHVHHAVLLLTYQPGELLRDIKCDERFYFSLGQFINKLHFKLQPFCSSTALRRNDYLWSLTSVSSILPYVEEVIVEKEKRSLIFQTVTQFEETVISKLNILKKGIIHGDLNDTNLLVRSRKEYYDITGVIDFSDMAHSSYLFELSIAATYIGLNNPDNFVELVASLLTGYGEALSNDSSEFVLLKICICARLCQSLVLGLRTYNLNPSNQYLLNTQKIGWTLLKKLSHTDNVQFLCILSKKIYENKIKFFNEK